jgi:hypothetical protein
MSDIEKVKPPNHVNSSQTVKENKKMSNDCYKNLYSIQVKKISKKLVLKGIER